MTTSTTGGTEPEPGPDPGVAMHPAPRLTPEEITEVAEGLVKGRYFCATMCPPDMITSVFMIVALGGLANIEPDSIGNIIEDLDKAGPRSVNGYPCFFSCRVIHKADWAVIAEKATAAQAAMDAALGVTREPG